MNTPEAPPCGVDVLIAEDDAGTRTSLRLLLEKEGYTCAEAASGREALELARHCLPRCVLLDLSMPELDGFAVASQLRSDPRTRDARIHCLTGRRDPASRQQAERAGCEMYLTKPVDVATLLKVVQGQPVSLSTEWFTGLSKTDAEELLDWLDSNGHGHGPLAYYEGEGYAVECRWADGPAPE
jgi:CheY-like chemotaxis protein